MDAVRNERIGWRFFLKNFSQRNNVPSPPLLSQDPFPAQVFGVNPVWFDRDNCGAWGDEANWEK
jgi:hypothetical protein